MRTGLKVTAWISPRLGRINNHQHHAKPIHRPGRLTNSSHSQNPHFLPLRLQHAGVTISTGKIMSSVIIYCTLSGDLNPSFGRKKGGRSNRAKDIYAKSRKPGKQRSFVFEHFLLFWCNRTAKLRFGKPCVSFFHQGSRKSSSMQVHRLKYPERLKNRRPSLHVKKESFKR